MSDERQSLPADSFPTTNVRGVPRWLGEAESFPLASERKLWRLGRGGMVMMREVSRE